MTHSFLMWVLDRPVEWEIWGQNPNQNMQLQIAAATWQIPTRSNSVFCQITLVLAIVIYRVTMQSVCCVAGGGCERREIPADGLSEDGDDAQRRENDN